MIESQMKSAYFAIPSARPVAKSFECFQRWAQRGYGIATWRDTYAGPDGGEALLERFNAAGINAIVMCGAYTGYANAVNALAAEVLQRDPFAMWIVAGGDDTTPESQVNPDSIARQLQDHFRGTYGVMQPTGDRFAGGSIDNIAGSPWMGREWCERAHQGLGPMCPIFYHMCVDNALLFAAEREGVYLRRRDLTHHHDHFTRTAQGVNYGVPVPPHLAKANSTPVWSADKIRLANFEREYDVKWRPLTPRKFSTQSTQ